MEKSKNDRLHFRVDMQALKNSSHFPALNFTYRVDEMKVLRIMHTDAFRTALQLVVPWEKSA